MCYPTYLLDLCISFYFQERANKSCSTYSYIAVNVNSSKEQLQQNLLYTTIFCHTVCLYHNPKSELLRERFKTQSNSKSFCFITKILQIRNNQEFVSKILKTSQCPSRILKNNVSRLTRLEMQRRKDIPVSLVVR